MARSIQSKSSRGLYILLALYIVVSLSFYAGNIAGFIDKYFDLHHRVHTPFTFDLDTLHIETVRPEARAAGLAIGDILQKIDGAPYAGYAPWLTLIRDQLHPGDTLQITFLQPSGRVKTTDIHLAGYTHKSAPEFSEWGGVLALYGLPPLICLLIGYWVVAARPRDLNAWLILFILTYPETIFAIGSHWWPGGWEFWSSLWVQTQQVLTPVALLLFGFFFPERWRLDRKWPWLKYALTVPILICVVLLTWTLTGKEFHPAWGRSIAGTNLVGEAFFALAFISISLYCWAIFDKSSTASTADARRRLRVLYVGSALGLGSLLLFFVILPMAHVPVQQTPWLAAIGTVLFLVFPFTLAYVVVVQRAMDVRILLRMGTKYALARATLIVVRSGLLTAAILLLILIVRARSAGPHTVIEIVILGVLFLMLRLRFVRDLSSRLDRRFFREAYNAEQLLAELSQQVRRYNDSGPMLDLVSRSLAQTLHIDKIAVLLRGGNAFHLQQATGLGADGLTSLPPVQLPLNSTTVRNLARVNTPVTLYRENPDGWLMLASPSERRLLDSMSAELLLPLPGREQLMGLITLGPKRSEEPYTPTDLRLLESVATQTGLALEIGELARSLANAAAQRERINREMEVAREVQERLFPQQLPEFDGVSLAGHCRPAQGVGGDYYDLFTLGDGRMGLAIGDVSGKGISAALLMASLRASLRGMALEAPHDLAIMMEKVNRLVYEASASNRYATFFFATFNPATRELVYVNAGHNAPFLVHRDGDTFRVERLEAGGPVIGLLPSVAYEEQRCILSPGDLLLSYTDGISEAMTEADEEWGEERMLAAAQAQHGADARKVLDHLFTEADRFTGKAPQYDDMTLLILKLEDEGSPQPENSALAKTTIAVL